jgi:hypothetical protein
MELTVDRPTAQFIRCEPTVNRRIEGVTSNG